MTTTDSMGMPFGSFSIPRSSELRTDDEWLAQAHVDPGARLLVLSSDLRVAMGGEDTLAWRQVPDDLNPSHLVLLGHVDGAVSFAIDGTDAPELVPESSTTVNVREAIGALGAADASALLQAVGVISWHRRHPFCSACGTPSLPSSAGHVRLCPACATTHFPRTDPAVIMLVTAGDACVLGQRAGNPSGRWSTLAGYVEPGESLEAAVAREVYEEVGLTVDGVTYVGSQPWPFPASLMVAFEATAERAELSIDKEHVAVRWFEREELREGFSSGTIAVPGLIAAGGYLIRRWVG